MVHITNIGSVAAVLSRGGTPKQISFTHTVADKGERQRIVSNGGVVSSSGQVSSYFTHTTNRNWQNMDSFKKLIFMYNFTPRCWIRYLYRLYQKIICLLKTLLKDFEVIQFLWRTLARNHNISICPFFAVFTGF